MSWSRDLIEWANHFGGCFTFLQVKISNSALVSSLMTELEPEAPATQVQSLYPSISFVEQKCFSLSQSCFNQLTQDSQTLLVNFAWCNFFLSIQQADRKFVGACSVTLTDLSCPQILSWRRTWNFWLSAWMTFPWNSRKYVPYSKIIHDVLYDVIWCVL